jgi:hypothetical protein
MNQPSTGPLIKLSWPKFRNDFNQIIKRLKKLSRLVDMKAEEVRLRDDCERNTELLSEMELMKSTKISDDVLPCYLVPFGVDEQFHGRLSILESLQKGLHHEKGALKVNVLWRMGGVGKTKISLQYINKSRQDFDAIFFFFFGFPPTTPSNSRKTSSRFPRNYIFLQTLMMRKTQLQQCQR